MKSVRRWLLTVLILAWSGLALAQTMEILQLRSRSAEEVLPALLPLVEPGGTLTGMNDQLFLKASPANRADIRRALAALDRPQRRLVIRVAHDRQAEAAASGAGASGQIALGANRRVEGQAAVWDTRSVRGERSAQMVQTVDGGRAYIQVGRSLPIPMRQTVIGPGGVVVSETVVQRDIGSGFYAMPRVNGERVTIDIAQQAESADHRVAGGIQGQRLATTVSGRLGEWIEIGGSGRQAAGRQGGGFSVGTGDVRDHRSIWLMVETAD